MNAKEILLAMFPLASCFRSNLSFSFSFLLFFLGTISVGETRVVLTVYADDL